MNRDKVREKTMQLIYQMDAIGIYDVDAINPMDEDLKILDIKQAEDTFNAIKNHLDYIDNIISDHTDQWSFDRIARTDLAIMRTAVAEILYLDYIPNAVSVSEAVKLAKKYSDEKSYKFVNSVLGKIVRSIES